MPIISNSPGGSGSGGGIVLADVSNIQTVTASGKVYLKQSDPANKITDGITVMEWAGTKVV